MRDGARLFGGPLITHGGAGLLVAIPSMFGLQLAGGIILAVMTWNWITSAQELLVSKMENGRSGRGIRIENAADFHTAIRW